MGIFDDIAKGAKSIVKSPITQAVVGGAAIVFPPAGVPAAAGLAIANQTLNAVDAAKAGKARARVSVGPRGLRAGMSAGMSAADKVKLLRARGAKKARARAEAAQARVGKGKIAQAIAKRRAAKRKPATMGQIKARRAALAAKLKNTKALAAQGNVGAKRALAAFRIVAKAKKGDPQAQAAVRKIADLWKIQQAVRSRHQLVANGRIRRVL